MSGRLCIASDSQLSIVGSASCSVKNWYAKYSPSLAMGHLLAETDAKGDAGDSGACDDGCDGTRAVAQNAPHGIAVMHDLLHVFRRVCAVTLGSILEAQNKG